MDTKLKLCSDKKKVGVLESEVKRLTQQQTEVCGAQKNGAVDNHDTEDAFAAKDAAEKHVVVLTEELPGVSTTHAQEVHTRDAEVEILKILLISAQMRVVDDKYERDVAKACLQQSQCDQRRYRAAVIRVH